MTRERRPSDYMEIFLEPGEFQFTTDPDVRLRTLLGSCVALTMWHPKCRYGAMCHFLLPSRGRSAQLVGERCDLPEDRWMQRGTFRTLFATIGELDFASVRAAAAYLTPGNEALAFSRRELEGDGYDYLLPLR